MECAREPELSPAVGGDSRAPGVRAHLLLGGWSGSM